MYGHKGLGWGQPTSNSPKSSSCLTWWAVNVSGMDVSQVSHLASDNATLLALRAMASCM